MDLKRYMLICIFISMRMDREKERDSYKKEVVVREGGRYSLTKLIRKGNNYQEKKKHLGLKMK